MDSEQEASFMQSLGDVVSETSRTSGVLAIILSPVASSALVHLWNLVNAQQIVVYFPLLNRLKFSANVIKFKETIIAIATYEMIPTKYLDELIYKLPFYDEAYNLGFEMLGYESKHLVGNMGFALWLIYFFVALALLFLLCYKCMWIRNRLGNYLFWGPLLILFLESFQEVFTHSILNLKTVEWDTENNTAMFSNILSLFFLILTFALALFFLVFFSRRRHSIKKLH